MLMLQNANGVIKIISKLLLRLLKNKLKKCNPSWAFYIPLSKFSVSFYNINDVII